MREEESDDNAVDTFPTGPEKELLQKHKLADLGKYDQHFPRNIKGDPNFFLMTKQFGWDNFFEKDGMQLPFKWLNSRTLIV